jgi:hypothetical protein
MKMTKQLVVAALALGVAVSAQADTWLNSVTPGSLNVLQGATGQSVFSFTDQTGAGTFSLTAAYAAIEANLGNGTTYTDTYGATPPPSAISGGIFSSVQIVSITGNSGNNVAQNTPVLMTVDWTVRSGATIGYSDYLQGHISASGGQSAAQEFTVVPVPEPAQTIAGAMLLGFGGLVFAGRRMFKKA